jgi:hypothetical protein
VHAVAVTAKVHGAQQGTPHAVRDGAAARRKITAGHSAAWGTMGWSRKSGAGGQHVAGAANASAANRQRGESCRCGREWGMFAQQANEFGRPWEWGNVRS